MLTAQDATDDRVRGLDLGADDYLSKPFQIDELLARLRAVIRRSAGQTTSTIQLGDFNLDLKAKQLTRVGEKIPVPAREYNLIEYLALHRGEVISRTELYDHLFGEEDSTLSNVLDVNVSRVRSKFGKDFIITHRGHGYSIE
jgi:two-component system OmpR family response regulator